MDIGLMEYLPSHAVIWVYVLLHCCDVPYYYVKSNAFYGSLLSLNMCPNVDFLAFFYKKTRIAPLHLVHIAKYSY